ncbi:hypothetical protein MKW98_015789 [Papaver atlanticum]|uniref:RRM domain-containing protein n=1 Tax=Papaver atlanticum TaxID=357466 RepID=A0AAD4SEI0_9MAGN|nr:hypothetical protein MKW98_015789 [Papaver atlanticum]
MREVIKSSRDDTSFVPPFRAGYVFPTYIREDRRSMRITGFEDVYPHACQIYSLNITDENREELQKDLTSMNKLSSKLDQRFHIWKKKYLSQEEIFLCIELAKKVPGITKMLTFADLSACQQLVIETFLEETKRREVVATYNPQAQVLQALLVSYNAEQLAQILNVPVDLTEKLKNKLPKTFDDPPEPAQLPKNLSATMDPREPAQHSVLQVIFLNIAMHQERISSCLKLLGIINHYIEVLRLRLGILKKEAVTDFFVDNLPLTFRIADVVRLLQTAENDVQMLRKQGFGFVTMSSAEEAQATAQKLNGLIIGGRTIRVNYGPPTLEERFQFGGGGSDLSKRSYVRNLSCNVDDQALETLFSKLGKVLEARVVYDIDGRSRGFGFVTYGSTEDSKNALSSLNGAGFSPSSSIDPGPDNLIESLVQVFYKSDENVTL